MRRLSFITFAILLLLPPVAAPDKIEHYISKEFSSDQIAVYSFILKSYRTLLRPTYRNMLAKTFYLQDVTEPLDTGELKRGQGCLKGIDLEVLPKDKIPTVHRFPEQKWIPLSVKSASGVKCVDSTPSKSRICWQTEGALYLTEILFDRGQTHALLGFGVRCAVQCGWGEIVILEKADGHWLRKAVCEEWYI